MSRPISIAVIGSVNLDIVASGAPLPRAGETVTGAVLHKYAGGKGANQALAARRLGADVTLHARTGSDGEAEDALALLRKSGVDLLNCEALNGVNTGVALIAVSPDGENQIIVASGANAAFPQSEAPATTTDALLAVLEIPVETVTRAAEQASGFVAVNLAPAQAVPDTLLNRADLLIVNEGEAAFYRNALHDHCGLVAVTYGAKGAALFENGKQTARFDGFTVTPVDTVGAGDTFCAALTLALCEGQSHDKALRFACAAGALATLKKGAQTALPLRAEVDAFLAKSDAKA